METMEKAEEPYIRIVEQPARSAVRFRYECEGRSAGPIPGVNASTSCATYPTIQIMNYAGSRAMVVVSCVTVSEPYRQHPHHLVGRVGCHNGICTMIVDNSDHLCTFTHLGIQCAKRNEIASRLKLRKSLQIDPTNGGFDHITKTSRSIDLGAIRLCFQAFVEDPDTRKFTITLKPVVSEAVYDKKLLPKLIITDISTTSCPMSGGKVMLFCNYIDEEDIEVRFYQIDTNGVIVWEAAADLKPPIGEVHKRVGISLVAPAYPDSHTPVNVYLELRRPSDNRTSDPIVFTYLPDCTYDNCPLLEFKRISPVQEYSTGAPISPHTTKRGRSKVAIAPLPKENYSSKRVKVMNVLNGSDSDDMDEMEDQEEDEDNSVYSPVSPPSYQSSVNYFFANNQSFAQNYQKADLNNNNLSQMQCNSSQGVYNNPSNSGQPSNDLLMECLKTIDIDCLAAMQFSDAHHTYSGEDWNQLNQAVSHYSDSYNNGGYNENLSFHSNQQTIPKTEFGENQEKLSFIDL